MEQLPLFVDAWARCQSCGRDVDVLVRVRRFRVCAECYARHVPVFETQYAETAEDRARVAAFWGWYAGLERRYPLALPQFKRRIQTERRRVVEFVPVCPVCGHERVETAWSQELSLFGRARHCPYCAAVGMVEAAWRLHGHTHAEWDDEDWLDWLQAHWPEAFTLGVLPRRWFELRRAVV